MRSSTWLVLALLVSPLAARNARAQTPAPQAQAAPAQPAAAQPAAAQPAAAQPAATPAAGATAAPAAPPESARDHFKRGESAYEKGNYPLAVSEWQAAFKEDPRPRIQYNIYQALERLGQLTEAATALQGYLSTADPDDPYYADATARMAALQQRLQATGIRLVGGPEGAAVNVSGHDWGLLPRPDRIPVQPGNHRVVISLAGHRDFVANVVVPAGQVVDVPVQMEASGPGGELTPAGATANADAGARSGGGGDPTPFFIASGVLGAGAVVGVIWTINRASELSGCDDPANYCPNKNAVSTQRTIAIGLTATLGVGAIATLIYGLVLNGQNSNKEHAALCVPTGAGASCRVRF